MLNLKVRRRNQIIDIFRSYVLRIKRTFFMIFALAVFLKLEKSGIRLLLRLAREGQPFNKMRAFHIRLSFDNFSR